MDPADGARVLGPFELQGLVFRRGGFVLVEEFLIGIYTGHE